MFKRKIVPTNSAKALYIEKTRNQEVILTAVFDKNTKVKAVLEDGLEIVKLATGEKKEYFTGPISRILRRGFKLEFAYRDAKMYSLLVVRAIDFRKALEIPWWWPFGWWLF